MLGTGEGNFKNVVVLDSRPSNSIHNIPSQFQDFVVRISVYRMSQDECARRREGLPYVKVYRYNPKHLCPKLNGYGDNGQRTLKL